MPVVVLTIRRATLQSISNNTLCCVSKGYSVVFLKVMSNSSTRTSGAPDEDSDSRSYSVIQRKKSPVVITVIEGKDEEEDVAANQPIVLKSKDERIGSKDAPYEFAKETDHGTVRVLFVYQMITYRRRIWKLAFVIVLFKRFTRMDWFLIIWKSFVQCYVRLLVGHQSSMMWNVRDAWR